MFHTGFDDESEGCGFHSGLDDSDCNNVVYPLGAREPLRDQPVEADKGVGAMTNIKSIKKRILVTAGATAVMIDKVRAISNIFKGRTGTEIALYFAGLGGIWNPTENAWNDFEVTLVTSNPTLANEMNRVHEDKHDFQVSWRVLAYRTYNELYDIMEREITIGNYDVVIHSSAVSDYEVEDVFVEDVVGNLKAVARDGKVPSTHENVFLKLRKTEKIVDKIKRDWGFAGKLVMFKLQVGIPDEELITIARKSMERAGADIIVANCLEWAHMYAYIIGGTVVEKVSRRNIGEAIWNAVRPPTLLEDVTRLNREHNERSNI